MSANLVASRYARALLKIAEDDAGKTDKLVMFLQGASGLFESEDFRKVLRSPVVPGDLKLSILSYIAEKLNSGDSAKKFAEQLVNAGRVGVIPQIFEEFVRLVNERRGIATAIVTSAEQLSAGFIPELEVALSKVFSKKLTVENKVNKDLLGGFVVEVGNYAIDMSVKTKLEALAEHAQL